MKGQLWPLLGIGVLLLGLGVIGFSEPDLHFSSQQTTWLLVSGAMSVIAQFAIAITPTLCAKLHK